MISRRRLRAVQRIVKEKRVGGLLLIPGLDSNYDASTAQLVGFLFESKCGYKVLETSTNDAKVEDLVLLITPTTFRCYCSRDAYSKIVAAFHEMMHNTLFQRPPSGEDDQDLLEEFKVGAFVQMVRNLKSVAFPCADPAGEIERWPLIQAYGLEGVGRPGFFSMNFKVLSLHDDLMCLYGRLDGCTLLEYADGPLRLFLQHYDELRAQIDREVRGGTLDGLSEADLIEPFDFYWRMGNVRGKGSFSADDAVFRPRLLAGTNTNDIARLSDASKTLGEMQAEASRPILHFIVEMSDPKTPFACTRTCFMSHGEVSREDLREGDPLYPLHLDITEVDDFDEAATAWEREAKDATLLVTSYAALVQAARIVVKGFGRSSKASLRKQVESAFHQALQAQGIAQTPRVDLEVHEIDLMGRLSEAQRGSPHLKRYRVFAKGFTSATSDALLGGLAFGDTFLDSNSQGGEGGEREREAVLTSSVPLSQTWPVLQAERIVHRFSSAFIRDMNDSGRIPSDILADFGPPLVEGPEEIELLAGSPVLASVRGRALFFEQGFIFYGPHTLPLVVRFKTSLVSFCRSVGATRADTILTFELKSAFGFAAPSSASLGGSQSPKVALALGTMDKSFVRLFNAQVWPRWTEILGGLGMTLLNATESGFPPSVAQTHAFVCARNQKQYPIELADAECEDLAAGLDGEGTHAHTQGGASVVEQTITEASVPVVVLQGLPGSGVEVLVDFVFKNLSLGYAWRVLKSPLRDLMGFNARAFAGKLQALVKACEDDHEATGTKGAILLPLVSHKDVTPAIGAVLRAKANCHLHSVIAAAHAMHLERSDVGIYEQLRGRYIDALVVFGALTESSGVTAALKAQLPDATIVPFKGLRGETLMRERPRATVAMPAPEATREKERETASNPIQDLVYVDTQCTLLKEEELVAVLAREIRRSHQAAAASRPELEEGAQDKDKPGTMIAWCKIISWADGKEGEEGKGVVREFSVHGGDVLVTTDESRTICERPTSEGVQWLFAGSALSRDHVTSLITACTQRASEEASPRGVADMTDEERRAVRAAHALDDLPKGWLHTGDGYINEITGDKTAYHPHFAAHAKEWIDAWNLEQRERGAGIVPLRVASLARL